MVHLCAESGIRFRIFVFCGLEILQFETLNPSADVLCGMMSMSIVLCLFQFIMRY